MTDDSAETARRLRLRRALQRQWLVVLVASVGLVIAGTALAVTAYVSPGTATEQRVTDSWSRSGAFTHSATVTEPNPAFEVGTRLRNRSTYLRPIAPRLNLTYATGYQASTDGRVDADVRLRLVHRATDGEGGVLWEVVEPLARVNQTLTPGERLRAPVTLNVGNVANRTRNLSRRLGTVGGTRTLVVAETELAGQVNGDQVTRRFTQQVTLSVGGDTYSVSGRQQASRTFRTRTQVTRDRQHGPLYRVGGPVLMLVGLAGVGGVLALRRSGRLELDPAERDWLAYRDDYQTYEEWLHTAALPPGADSLPEAEAATLGDLVDIAIDVDETVIEVPETGRFHVVDDEYRYVYEPPRPASLTDSDQETRSDTTESTTEDSTV